MRNLNIYEYMTKRARLYDHINKTRKMWNYCQTRAIQLEEQIKEDSEDQDANQEMRDQFKR